MKLTIEQRWRMNMDKSVEMIININDGMKEHRIVEVIPEDLCKNKEILRRAFDKMFYEAKKLVDKHYAL